MLCVYHKRVIIEIAFDKSIKRNTQSFGVCGIYRHTVKERGRKQYQHCIFNRNTPFYAVKWGSFTALKLHEKR